MAIVIYIPRINSDHSPLLIRVEGEPIKSGSGFTFQRMWTDHQDFLNVVAYWKIRVIGFPGIVLQSKLRRLKKGLTDWNWNTFGNIHIRKQVVHDSIQRLELSLHQGWDDLIHQELEAERTEMRQVESWENELICNKARLDWTKQGDRKF